MKRSNDCCGNATTNHNTLNNNNNNEDKNNAFNILMQAGGGRGGCGGSEGRSRTSSIDSSNKKLKTNSSQQQQQQQRKSQFVECPAGCGRHVLRYNLNNHLDQCMKIIANDNNTDQNVVVVSDDRKIGSTDKNDYDRKEDEKVKCNDETDEDKGKLLFSDSDTICEKIEENVVGGGGNAGVGSKIDKPVQSLDEVSGECKPSSSSRSARIPNTTTTSSTTDKSSSNNNIFSHMMKRSATVFASPLQQEKLSQRFHLKADGTVTLTCYTTYPGLSHPESIAWSETTQIKVPPAKTTTIDLIVSSSIPSFQASSSQTPIISLASSKEPQSKKNHIDNMINHDHRNHSFQQKKNVKRHSRLSIPVLKSILQKSIRRRKPLPSVRVAMELTDKSIDDILRRLPIIILEDSTLHPNFPLIIWLMVASSKGYIIPPNLIQKAIFQTIYEISSCRYRDQLRREEEKVDIECKGKEDSEVSLSSYHTNKLDYTATKNETIIWSFLLRIQYGGMKCDTTMLRRYANLWNTRFKLHSFPENLALKTISTNSNNNKKNSNVDEQQRPEKQQDFCCWSQIPTLIHQQSTSTNNNNFELLCKNGIQCLTITDMTWEGIDFHCSSVIDTILNDHKFIEKCNERLLSSLSGYKTGDDDVHRKSCLEGILKSCMWKYSSSINRRLPLLENHNDVTKGEIDGSGDSKNEEDDHDKTLRAFWNEMVLPSAKKFAERYVKDRLC